MTAVADIEVWMGALSSATAKVAVEVLGCDPPDGATEVESCPDHFRGSFCALVGDEESLQMGLLGDMASCEGLARVLLDCGEEMELSEADVSDSMGELINILAGLVKTDMVKVEPTLKLGLPMYVRGQLVTNNRQRKSIQQVKIGPVEATLMIVQSIA